MASVDEFLKALHENDEIKAFIAEHPLEEGMSKEDGLLALAQRFGYEVAPEDLSAALAARATKIAEARAGAEDAVIELSDEDLAAVAGGKGDPKCKDSYIDGENCWSTDDCNFIVNGGYQD